MVQNPAASFPLILLLLLLVAGARADPDLLFDFCVADTAGASAASGLFFNGVPCMDPAAALGSHFATAALATRGGDPGANPFGFAGVLTDARNLPGGNGQGLALLREDFAPGGVLPLHAHPRASEAVVVLDGELLVGFVDTGNRLFSQRIGPLEAFVFPRGLLHFQYNPNRSAPATAIAVFDSQNPGAQLVAPAAFLSNPPIDVEPLSKSYQITQEDVQKIRKNLGG